MKVRYKLHIILQQSSLSGTSHNLVVEPWNASFFKQVAMFQLVRVDVGSETRGTGVSYAAI